MVRLVIVCRDITSGERQQLTRLPVGHERCAVSTVHQRVLESSGPRRTQLVSNGNGANTAGNASSELTFYFCLVVGRYNNSWAISIFILKN